MHIYVLTRSRFVRPAHEVIPGYWAALKRKLLVGLNVRGSTAKNFNALFVIRPTASNHRRMYIHVCIYTKMYFIIMRPS